jgi:hypothetical protein
MNLISFDIGIKNMAYCVFHLDSDSMQCSAWNVLNLMQQPSNDAAEVAPCSSCKRKSKFKKGDTFYCEAHTKLVERPSDLGYVRPGKKWTLPALRKLKLAQMIELMRDDCKLDVSDSPTKTVCLERLQEWMQRSVLEPSVPAKVKTKSANDADLIEVGRQLAMQLDAALTPTMGHVIIENQISPLASRMRTLQGMLTQYFIMRHPAAEIHYISSSNKLKEFASNPTTTTTTTASQKYLQHKTDGILHCANVLRANPSIGFTADTLLTHAKKDDLADCWLQAIWFLKHGLRRINWSAEDLKINCIAP